MCVHVFWRVVGVVGTIGFIIYAIAILFRLGSSIVETIGQTPAIFVACFVLAFWIVAIIGIPVFWWNVIRKGKFTEWTMKQMMNGKDGDAIALKLEMDDIKKRLVILESQKEKGNIR
jgi:hypothetical protein